MITKHTGGRDQSAANAAKQRYNAKTYDQIKIFVKKGGRDLIHQLAAAAGMSLAEYIRFCIIKDAEMRGFDTTEQIE